MVIKEIEGRCGVRVTFPENQSEQSADISNQSEQSAHNNNQSEQSADNTIQSEQCISFTSHDVREVEDQVVCISGECNDDIAEAMVSHGVLLSVLFDWLSP